MLERFFMVFHQTWNIPFQEPKIVVRFLERSWLKSLSAGSLQFKVQPLYRRSHSAVLPVLLYIPWTVFLVWNSHKESMRKFSYLLNHKGIKSILTTKNSYKKSPETSSEISQKSNPQKFTPKFTRNRYINWKGYLPNLLESALLCQIFVFWVRDFKFWLLAYFFLFSLTVQSFRKNGQHLY